MGLLQDIFGGKGDKVTPSGNKGGRVARDDYIKEYKESGRDPIPKEPPDWAKDLPDPRDYVSGGDGGKSEK